MPSSIALPKLPGSATPNVPATLPACSLPGVTSQAVSLRNQPCRAYAPDRRATGVVATAVGDDLKVDWTAPGGAAPDSYVVTPALGAGAPAGSTAPAATTVAGGTTTATFAGAPEGVPLEVTVEAVYGADTARASDASLPVAITPQALRLFGTWNAFVTRQLLDFTGSAKAAAVTEGVNGLESGVPAADFIAGLRWEDEADINPVTRLYLGVLPALARPGRPGVLGAEAGHRHHAHQGVEQLAGSSEFKTKYGSLSNRAFVELVYKNVLGRTGDGTGITYWTNQLNTRKKRVAR